MCKINCKILAYIAKKAYLCTRIECIYTQNRMKFTLELIAALLPALVLGLYIWKRDPHPEPGGQIIKALLWGVAICMPVAFAEFYIQRMVNVVVDPTTLWGSTVKAFVVAAWPEETAKLLALWLFVYKNPYFDEHFDGIVYAVSVSLGFAAIENVFYVIGSQDWLSVAIMRALLSVPGHYAFGILMGYYFSRFFFVERSLKNGALMLLMPFLAHGAYDAIALSGSVNPVAGSVSFVVLVYFCIKLQRQAQARVRELAGL